MRQKTELEMERELMIPLAPYRLWHFAKPLFSFPDRTVSSGELMMYTAGITRYVMDMLYQQ